MFCCAKPRSPGPPRPDRQTEFLLQKHEMELERIGRLANPPFARRNGPFLVEGPGGGRTLKEKMFLQEGLLSRLEAAGWFLKGPVEALWAGERRLAKLQAASEHCTDQLTFIIEAILRAVPRGAGADAAAPTPALPPASPGGVAVVQRDSGPGSPGQKYSPGDQSPPRSPDSGPVRPGALRRTPSRRRMAVSAMSPAASQVPGNASMEDLNLGAGTLGGRIAARSVKPKPKPTHERALIAASMQRNSLLAGLDEAARDQLVQCMGQASFEKGTAIITQGEGSQSTYHLIKSGRCEAHIDGVFSHTLGPGASFGETALLYDSPPIATVRAAEDSDVTAWTVSREDFQRIVVDAAMARRRQYDGFLASMALLKPLGMYERGVIADALVSTSLSDGEVALQEGIVTDSVFFVYEGRLTASSSAPPPAMDAPKKASSAKGPSPRSSKQQRGEMVFYKRGDYFGSVSLLTDAPQPATITAVGEATVLSLQRRVFKKVTANSVGVQQLLLKSGQQEGGATPNTGRNAALVSGLADVPNLFLDSEEEVCPTMLFTSLTVLSFLVVCCVAGRHRTASVPRDLGEGGALAGPVTAGPGGPGAHLGDAGRGVGPGVPAPGGRGAGEQARGALGALARGEGAGAGADGTRRCRRQPGLLTLWAAAGAGRASVRAMPGLNSLVC